MIGALSHGGARAAAARPVRGCALQQRAPGPRRGAGPRIFAAGSNGSGSNGATAPACPTPAETARTIVDIVNEAALCSLSPDGTPLGAPVVYSLDSDGQPVIQVAGGSPAGANLARDARVSLLVQPTSFPARGVASVALQGTVAPADADEGASGSGVAAFKLSVEQCVYYGGLDNVSARWRCAVLRAAHISALCAVFSAQPRDASALSSHHISG